MNDRKREGICSESNYNKANRHKLRALGTMSHKTYKKLRNVQKFRNCTEVSEMYSKTPLHFTTVQNSSKSTEKEIKNEVITD